MEQNRWRRKKCGDEKVKQTAFTKAYSRMFIHLFSTVTVTAFCFLAYFLLLLALFIYFHKFSRTELHFFLFICYSVALKNFWCICFIFFPFHCSCNPFLNLKLTSSFPYVHIYFLLQKCRQHYEVFFYFLLKDNREYALQIL